MISSWCLDLFLVFYLLCLDLFLVFCLLLALSSLEVSFSLLLSSISLKMDYVSVSLVSNFLLFLCCSVLELLEFWPLFLSDLWVHNFSNNIALSSSCVFKIRSLSSLTNYNYDFKLLNVCISLDCRLSLLSLRSTQKRPSPIFPYLGFSWEWFCSSSLCGMGISIIIPANRMIVFLPKSKNKI